MDQGWGGVFCLILASKVMTPSHCIPLCLDLESVRVSDPLMNSGKFLIYLLIAVLPIVHCASASANASCNTGKRDPSKVYSSATKVETRVWIFPVSDPARVDRRKTLTNIIKSGKLNAMQPSVACAYNYQRHIYNCMIGQYQSRAYNEGDLITVATRSGAPITLRFNVHHRDDLECDNYGTNRRITYQLLQTLQKSDSNEVLPAIGILQEVYDITPSPKYGESYF